MGDKTKSFVKYGSLKTKYTCRNVLWGVDNFSTVRDERKAIRSDFFSVSTLPNCLFYLALNFEEIRNKFTVSVNRCITHSFTKEFEANILLEFEDIDKSAHFTKSFGMTQDISYVSTLHDFRAVHDILIKGSLYIHCSIILKEIASTESFAYLERFKGKSWSRCSVITVSELKEHIGVMLEGDILNKVIIEVDNEEYPVHKDILCSHSPVFSAMFFHETLENQQNRIQITDVRKEVMGEMLKFIYTGCTSELTPFMNMELFIAADKYAVLGLKERCSRFLVSSLNQELVLDVLVLAEKYTDSNLKTIAIQYLIEKTPHLLEKDEFLTFIQSECEIIRDIILSLVKQNTK